MANTCDLVRVSSGLVNLHLRSYIKSNSSHMETTIRSFSLLQALQLTFLVTQEQAWTFPRRRKMETGHLTVEVGLQNEEGGGGLQKLTMPVTYINHPYFAGLLDRAKKVYGYRSGAPGQLKLPCTVEEFIHVKSLVERESGGSQ